MFTQDLNNTTLMSSLKGFGWARFNTIWNAITNFIKGIWYVLSSRARHIYKSSFSSWRAEPGKERPPLRCRPRGVNMTRLCLCALEPLGPRSPSRSLKHTRRLWGYFFLMLHSENLWWMKVYNTNCCDHYEGSHCFPQRAMALNSTQSIFPI